MKTARDFRNKSLSFFLADKRYTLELQFSDMVWITAVQGKSLGFDVHNDTYIWHPRLRVIIASPSLAYYQPGKMLIVTVMTNVKARTIRDFFQAVASYEKTGKIEMLRNGASLICSATVDRCNEYLIIKRIS